MMGTQFFSCLTTENWFSCLVIDKGQYYLVSFFHVVISENKISSFVIISASQIVFYYKYDLIVGLHYPIIFKVSRKDEIIFTFHNMNLTISGSMSLVVLFFIMTQISWDITQFQMCVTLSIWDRFPLPLIHQQITMVGYQIKGIKSKSNIRYNIKAINCRMVYRWCLFSYSVQ